MESPSPARRASFLVIACFALVVASSPALARYQLIDGDEIAFFGVGEFPRWTAVLRRHDEELRRAPAACAEGVDEYCALLDFMVEVERLRGAAPAAQLRAVNDLVNQVTYQEDIDNYGVVDYWASPLQLFRYDGDCEDFAIAKYIALLELGFAADRMRLMVVNDERRDVAHAVLTVRMADGAQQVLDSVTNDVRSVEQIHHYRPIYSLSAARWWLHDRDALRNSLRADPRPAGQ